MSTSSVRTAAVAALLAAVGVPLAFNEWSRFGHRRADATRAAHFAAAADAARATGDLELAATALSEATVAAPGEVAYAERLLDVHVEQLLAGTARLTPRTTRRLAAELAVASSGPKAGDLRYLLAGGRLAQARDRGDEARAVFERAVSQAPDNPKAHLFLGDAWLKAGKYEEAAVALERAMALDPKSAEARFALGQTRLAQDRFDVAEPLLVEAARTLTRNAVLLRSLGKAQVRQRKFAEATVSLERALTIDRTLDGVHALLGEAYANTGKPEAAIGALRIAWEQSQDVAAYRNLGRVLLQVGRHAEAVQVFQTLQALDSTDPEPLIALSMAAQAAGDLRMAAEALRGAEALIDKAENPAAVAEWKKVAEQRRASLTQATAASPPSRPPR